MKKKILAVVGATASGKTDMAISLAKEFDGEIVSADSMQIYKGMDIATAKPSKEEMQGIPHHLIDFLERDVSFSVADYVKLANEKISDIISRGKLPIIAGGTGLYIDSLLNNVKFSETKKDEEYCKSLEKFAEINGNDELYKILAETDPESAVSIHPNNLVRVIRALEVYHTTGRKLSELKAESRLEESPYDSFIISLDYSKRDILYDRINRRVDIMLERGLVDEARNLYLESGKMKTASNAIGYKELIPYFENVQSFDECVDKIKQETRHYAKRQLTWFRKNQKINWFLLDKIDEKNKIPQICRKIIAK